jgi:hypothetical protein
VTGYDDGARMAAGIASLAAHERAQQAAARLDAERAGARPAPVEITERPGRTERAVALLVRCPFCRASPGQVCQMNTRAKKPMSRPHPTRVEAGDAEQARRAALETQAAS